MNHMPYREALARLSHTLVVASDELAAAAATILHEGAGLLPLPAGAILTAPAGLVAERREVWLACAEALARAAGDTRGDAPPAADTPVPLVRAGAWEPVLATLLVLREDETILATARELRAEDSR